MYSSTFFASISTLYFLELKPKAIISFFYRAIGFIASNLNVEFNLEMLVPFDDPRSTIIIFISALKKMLACFLLIEGWSSFISLL